MIQVKPVLLAGVSWAVSVFAKHILTKMIPIPVSLGFLGLEMDKNDKSDDRKIE